MKTPLSSFVVAFDVGGSHVTAGLCRLNDLAILDTASSALAGDETFDSFADLLFRLGREASGDENDVAGASLAVPFPFDCAAGVSLMQHKFQPLYGKNLRTALASRFGWRPDQLRFLNDACAYLLGEIGAGSVKGAARSAGLTLGTGIGSAFAVGGRCVTAGDGVPPEGEIWNLPFAGATVEDYISTRAIKGEYVERTGRELEVSQIAAVVGSDDDAREVFENFGAHLGEVLRDIIAPFRPERVMIGGGISRSANLFLPAAEKNTIGLGFRVVQSELLDLAPLAGAAHFWREDAEASEPADTRGQAISTGR